jgi:UDP-N-acetylmuramate dehydrogenase
MSRSGLAAALRAIPGLDGVVEDAPLAPYTTWRVGGPADIVCAATSVDALVAAVAAARAQGVPWRTLGRGSNVLVSDEGVDGLVILNRAASLVIHDATAQAESGVLLSVLARRTAGAGLAGLEWGAGIPGTVGGGLVSNAGAHGGCMADTLQQVQLLDGSGAIRWDAATSLELAYRHSRLRHSSQQDELVLRAEFALAPEDPQVLHARMAEQKRQRQMTQPLSSPTAGSVFKNPPGESAARLIDQAGLKGMCIGGATVSTRHANFMVTSAGACSTDLAGLITLVQERVCALYGIHLDLEVQAIGRTKAPALA